MAHPRKLKPKVRLDSIDPENDFNRADDEPPIYHRKPNEPAIWYNRFKVYCLAGQSRTIIGAYRQVAADEAVGMEKITSVPQTWSEAVRRWEWYKRAEAYDCDRINNLEAELAEWRLDERDRRRELLDGLFEECQITKAQLVAMRKESAGDAEVDGDGVGVATDVTLLTTLNTKELQQYANSVKIYCDASRKEAGEDKLGYAAGNTSAKGIKANQALERKKLDDLRRARGLAQMEKELANLTTEELADLANGGDDEPLEDLDDGTE